MNISPSEEITLTELQQKLSTESANILVKLTRDNALLNEFIEKCFRLNKSILVHELGFFFL